MMPSSHSKASKPLPSVAPPEPPLKRAPTLYCITGFKLIKGALFFILAIILYFDATHDLPAQYQWLVAHLRIHPENRFFTRLAEDVGALTEAKVRWAAVGTLVWSLFPLVEGIGLLYRAGWAGWTAIAESAFFVPIEFWELARKFSWFLVGVTVINIFIVVYLYMFRNVLFHHHRFRHKRRPALPDARAASGAGGD